MLSVYVSSFHSTVSILPLYYLFDFSASFPYLPQMKVTFEGHDFFDKFMQQFNNLM